MCRGTFIYIDERGLRRREVGRQQAERREAEAHWRTGDSTQSHSHDNRKLGDLATLAEFDGNRSYVVRVAIRELDAPMPWKGADVIMGDEHEVVDAGGERRKDTFWLVTALGLLVVLKGVALILDLAAILK
jgi:hypothetical protein